MREQNVKQSFDRIQRRNYNRPYGQRTFYINRSGGQSRFDNRRRPYGNLRFLRRKGVDRFGGNRYNNNDRSRYNYSRGRGGRFQGRRFNNRRGMFVVEGLHEADSEDEEENGEMSREQVSYEQEDEEMDYVGEERDGNEKREVDVDNLFIDEKGRTYGIEDLQNCVFNIEPDSHTDVENNEERRGYGY